MHGSAPTDEPPADVIVIGGGNAALCAAMTARHLVNRVVLLERAPVELRGGNTRHTRNIRHTHPRPDAYVADSYGEDEMWHDLVRVSGSDINEELARLTTRASESCPAFMESHGARWQPPLRGALSPRLPNAISCGDSVAILQKEKAAPKGGLSN